MQKTREMPTDKYKTKPTEYYWSTTHEAWIAWQAAQAAMQAELAGWISVGDRLPPNWHEAIVWPNPTDYCMTAWIEPGKGWIYNVMETGHGQAEYACTVTHWMPVPDSPIDAEIARTGGAA